MISIIVAAALIRRPLGDMTARIHPVILVNRPGHGLAMAGARAYLENSTPAIPGRIISEVLEQLGIGPEIVVVHCRSGALARAWRSAIGLPYGRVAAAVAGFEPSSRHRVM